MSMKIFRDLIRRQTTLPNDVALSLPRIASAPNPKFPAREVKGEIEVVTEISMNKITMH
jgi:hypothetical protein